MIYNSRMKENPDGVSRRKFMREGLAAALAGAAVIGIKDAEASPRNTTALPPDLLSETEIFKSRIAAAEQAYRGARVRALLETGDPQEALTYLTNHVMDPEWEKLSGKEFDVRPLQKKVVLVGVEQTQHGKKLRTTSLERATVQDVMTLADADQGVIGYGQAIPFDSTHAILPQHVFAALRGAEGVTGLVDLTYDAAIAEFSQTRFSREQIATFEPMTDDDVHGKFVAITGIRPDDNMGRTGRKTYGGMAIKVTPPLYNFFEKSFTNIKPEDKRALSKSLVVISATAEGVPAYSAAQRRQAMPGAGMSGGIMGLRSPTGFKECGFLWGGCPLTHNGKVYSAFFLHGPDVVLPMIRRAKPHAPARAARP